MALAAYAGLVAAVFLFLAGLGGGATRQGLRGDGDAAIPALAGPQDAPGDPDAGAPPGRTGQPAGGAGGAAGGDAGAAAGAEPDLWQALGERLWGWRAALSAAWPGSSPAPGEDAAHDRAALGRRLAQLALERLSGIRLDEPLTLVAAHFPAAHDLEMFEEEGGPVVGRLAPPDVLAGGLPRVRPPAGAGGEELAVAGDRPRVLIYHTHTSEAYVGAVPASSGFDPAVEAFTGDPGSSVVGVGTVVQDVLERAGIGVVHLRQVFDRDGQRVTRIGNYQRSLTALTGGRGQGVLDRYPTVDVVIDIHRDGVGRDRTVATVQGQKAASILFVVGTDRRLEHPEWRKNYCFVQWIVRELNQRHPGLVKGVLLSENRYNQHVRPGALLVEVGGYGNTPEEAERSARMLGEALAAVVRDGHVPQPGKAFQCPPGVKPPR